MTAPCSSKGNGRAPPGRAARGAGAELADGLPYSVPGAEYNRLRSYDLGDPRLERHRYVQLPAALWTRGWLAVLSGPALAMLLVLVNEAGGRDQNRDLWFSPGLATRRYALSEDSRSAGVRELARAGIITITRRDTNPDPFATRRRRNVYRLLRDQLDAPAAVPPPEPSLHGAADTTTGST